MSGTDVHAARARIHRIAAGLFALHGYHATGMAKISEAVGLGRGALYHHIRSKESVLFAISNDTIDQLLEPSRLIVARDESAESRMRALARVLVVNVAEFSSEWTVFFREHVALSDRLHQQVVAKRDEYEGLWLQLLVEGARTGEFRQVDPILTKGILGMFNYAHLWLKSNGPTAPQEVADHFCEVLLDGLLAERR